MGTISYGGVNYDVPDSVAITAMKTARTAARNSNFRTIVVNVDGEAQAMLVGPGISFAVTVENNLDEDAVRGLVGAGRGFISDENATGRDD